MKSKINNILKSSSSSVMGILNVTPDSFSDGGKFVKAEYALKQVEQMIKDGAKIIDIGGESTRPGAKDVSVEDELSRVIPVLSAVKSNFDIAVSIDTSKWQVMDAALELNADIINDVRALQGERCIEIVAKSDAYVCLMHMQGQPRTMQSNPVYDDLLADITAFFEQRISSCQNAGIKKDKLILDPGFGFGKTLEQNYQLLANLSYFDALKLPILSGTSRKSMIGNLLNRSVEERLAGSLSSAIIAAQQGAKIIRVHDVKETVDALHVLNAVIESQ